MKVPAPTTPLPKANAIKLKSSVKMTGFSGKLSPGKVSMTHHFSNGGTKSFNFHDPEVATAHIRRALKHQWQHPEKNEAAAIDTTLNIPPAV